ncbi:MAG TPA: STAS domain-containing protein [Steroidobacteraceae bacterium]|nr:STAS domain-containing protein [Steroidobacteraceae bacterium]
MTAPQVRAPLPDTPFLPEEGGYRLQAPLLFGTVPELREQGVALISASHEQLRMDLSAVASADSAGLALLIDWLACARSAGKQLLYLRVPEALLALARLSDVAALLKTDS